MIKQKLPFTRSVSDTAIYSGEDLIATIRFEEYAEFIVRACNSHYELLEALEKARHDLTTYQGLFASDLIWQDRLPHLENGTQVEFQIDDSETLSLIDAAIAKAEGK